MKSLCAQKVYILANAIDSDRVWSRVLSEYSRRDAIIHLLPQITAERKVI